MTSIGAGRASGSMTDLTRARFVAVLFLGSTLTFLLGSGIVDAVLAMDSPTRGRLAIGVALVAATGVAVLGIGLLLRPVLRRHTPRLADAYLALRLLECLALVGTGIVFLVSLRAWEEYDLLVYACTGSAGLILSIALWHSRIVARWLAALGLAGYALLLVGGALDAAGVVDLNATAGPVFFGVGGAFEVLFPLVLLFRGFAHPGGSLGSGSQTASRTLATSQDSR